MAVHRIERVYIIQRKGTGDFVGGPFVSLTGLNCHITQDRKHHTYSFYKNLEDFEIIPYKCEEEQAINLADHEKARGKM